LNTLVNIFFLASEGPNSWYRRFGGAARIYTQKGSSPILGKRSFMCSNPTLALFDELLYTFGVYLRFLKILTPSISVAYSNPASTSWHAPLTVFATLEEGSTSSNNTFKYVHGAESCRLECEGKADKIARARDEENNRSSLLTTL